MLILPIEKNSPELYVSIDFAVLVFFIFTFITLLTIEMIMEVTNSTVGQYTCEIYFKLASIYRKRKYSGSLITYQQVPVMSRKRFRPWHMFTCDNSKLDSRRKTAQKHRG